MNHDQHDREIRLKALVSVDLLFISGFCKIMFHNTVSCMARGLIAFKQYHDVMLVFAVMHTKIGWIGIERIWPSVKSNWEVKPTLFHCSKLLSTTILTTSSVLGCCFGRKPCCRLTLFPGKPSHKTAFIGQLSGDQWNSPFLQIVVFSLNHCWKQSGAPQGQLGSGTHRKESNHATWTKMILTHFIQIVPTSRSII